MASGSAGATKQSVALFLGDPVLTEPAARSYIDAVLPPERREMDLEVVRIPERKLVDVLDAISQVGMFGAGRCIWIRGLGAEPAEEAAEFHAAVAVVGVPDGYTLVATAAKLDMRGRLAKWFRDSGQFIDLRVATDKKGNLDEHGVRRLVEDRLAAAGLPPPEPPAFAIITARAGGDAGQLAGEIDKLCLLCEPGRALNADVVARNMRDLSQAWVFDLTDAIGRRSLGDAREVLAGLVAAGEPPLKILAALAENLSGLLEARASLPLLPPGAMRNGGAFVKHIFPELPERTRSSFRNNAWRAWFAIGAASAFEIVELRRLHTHLADIDMRMKGSAADPAHLLFSFLLEACAPRARRNAQPS